MIEHLKKFIATGGYLGLMPVAPGTFGALWGVGLHLAGWCFLPKDLLVPWLVAWLLLVSWQNHVLTPWAVEKWRGKARKEGDPGQFILDEIAGYLVVPIVFQVDPFVAAIYGFLLFRVLDIIKIQPARWIDRNLHGSWGILLDDLVSGAYAGLLLHIAMLFWSVERLLFWL
ncbi:MAG TPA: phosphatidylglycerophosphatase A [bacterium]|nr:phosphatidylglycerophosphatase A [bacterium]